MIGAVEKLVKKYGSDTVYRRARESYRSLVKLVFRSPVLSRVFAGVTYPAEVFVFLTTRCNIRCLICRREDHKPVDVDPADLYKLGELFRHASLIDLTGWGEPFTYRELDAVLNFIFANSGKRDVLRITTNGTLLDERYGRLLNGRLAGLTISLNAATRETYNRDMKFSDFDKVVANIEQFVSVLDPGTLSRLSLHFVAHAENFRELSAFVELAASLRIGRVTVGNYIISTEEHLPLSLLNVKRQYNDAVEAAEKAALDKGVRFTAKKFFAVDATADPDRECHFPFTQLFVQPDGEVSGPCCYAGAYPMGNVYRDGYRSVWFGEKYRKLREKRHLPACGSCTVYSSFDSPHAHFDSAFFRANRERIEASLPGEEQ